MCFNQINFIQMNISFKTIAVANRSGAMEADTISKNGRNPKSQTSRENNIKN